jgi:hypothetical protein
MNISLVILVTGWGCGGETPYLSGTLAYRRQGTQFRGSFESKNLGADSEQRVTLALHRNYCDRGSLKGGQFARGSDFQIECDIMDADQTDCEPRMPLLLYFPKAHWRE